MKTILIALNMLLAALLVWNGIGIVRNIRAAKPEAGFTVKKKIPGAARLKKDSTAPETSKSDTSGTATPQESEPPLTISAQADNIIKANIFNQERCPNSGAGSTRVEMTLVGTFTIGNASGAIILQKAQTREMPFPWMNQGQFGQQRQMGIGQRGGNMGANTGANMGANMAGNQNNTGGSRRQFGGNRGGQFNRSGGTGSSMQGSSIQGSTQGTNSQSQTFKQYVRLGETLSNGYKLVEVTRTRVVLTRGGDKMELELVEASKNQNQTGAARSTAPNQTQVMQQMLNSMQQMQMMQGMQMMRMGQQGQQDNQPPQNTGRNGTAARARR